MRGVSRIAACAPLDLTTRGCDLRYYNVERVRGYLETHLGCSQKAVAYALGLNRRTVANAIKAIRYTIPAPVSTTTVAAPAPGPDAVAHDPAATVQPAPADAPVAPAA